MTRFDASRLTRIDARMADWVAAGSYERLEWCIGDARGIAHQHATAALSVYRIYSMTKPLVSVIALQLIEEGRLQLFHPVARYLEDFKSPMVFTPDGPRRAARPMLIHHLMTHMSGLSYGFMGDATGQMMEKAGVHANAAISLRDEAKRIAAIPLQFEPGTDWLYSVATDILAAVVEVIEDKPLGDVIAERITTPLAMADTSFCPGIDTLPQIAPIKGGTSEGLLSPDALATSYPYDDPGFTRGGHGLYSTLADYATFAQTLLCDARGEGTPRLLSPTTLAHATSNHAHAVMPLHIQLPPQSVNPGMTGQGFGLGFAVSQFGGPLTSRPGAFGWSGAAETWFTVDPTTNLFAVLMAQNFDWPGASFDLQNMAYAALSGGD